MGWMDELQQQHFIYLNPFPEAPNSVIGTCKCHSVQLCYIQCHLPCNQRTVIALLYPPTVEDKFLLKSATADQWRSNFSFKKKKKKKKDDEKYAPLKYRESLYGMRVERG